MKTTLIACLLLCFSMASAQSDLFVSNGSYIYIDGTGFSSGTDVAPLYVTNDVNLENNSHLYLRNDAQLLQGNNVGNSGTGELSVYQEGNVNRWSYNYWCSPVGNTNADDNSNRQFIFQQQITEPTGLITNVTPTFTFNVDGNNATDPVTISHRWIYSFVSSEQYTGWDYIGDAADVLAPGLGFTMKGTSGNPIVSQAYDFRGKPNNGTISSPIADGLFTLIGNPYPSAIDSAALIHDIDNVIEIEGTILFWEHATYVESHVLADYIGGYHEFSIDPLGNIISNTPAVFQTYDGAGNIVGPVPPGPPGASKRAYRYIPIGQGFMVEGSTGIGPGAVVTLKNSHRVFEKEAPASSVFFRSNNPDSSTSGIQYQDNGLSLVPDDYKRFRVNVDFTVGEAEYTRQILLNFHDTATFEHDRGLELKRAVNLDSDAYFVQDSKNYSGLAYPFSQDLRIPIVVDIEEQQPLRFRIFDIQNFDESQGIYIHDTYNDVYVNLRDQDYELNIEPGNYTDRFEIVFTPGQALSINDLEVSDLIIRQDNDIHELSVINPNGLDVKTIEVFDMTGKRMLNQLYDSVSNRYQLSTVNLSDGVYIVNVTSKNNTVSSEKIIVKH
ncbi:T9SS type A sorting domain-containing protein [Winogradskyella aquimaris]|uniref:T9SS type A sorting domain-containing protein n=1 Tax=Winogradskyella aquimaris TaxID=864074 RepID=A0ABU5EQC1_9FLAO|nr:T9SS type A sorting domain-containing protein [Winogradskyella aquimaris]MDY2586877.1 T9SS type A sorting domain-containing protein [Winogradskyella aquimaris]